ncbi:uncharacterized protein AB675_410 [Cyphellophora attinorum]|uniref:Transcription factor domain-containing protein n=1 Tax=Cyphellophora attinorum TaxID=1664694 RepID=A0A0N1I204_9EURO|nr:uncharacterized protein AB675_410 [Phialophora attinorum]KPI46103.1 hypothetical protein AB675_410 [Phialophora attinorum]
MAPAGDDSLKPMRRGTRSCRESQGYIIDPARVAKSDSLLKVKVKRIESMVERLAKIQSEQAIIAQRDENGCSFERVQNSLVDGTELTEHASTASPLFRLFNNEVITRSDIADGPQVETTTTIHFADKDMSDLDKLKSTIAHDPDILDVVDVACEWWISWRDQQWVLRAGGVDPTVRSFVQERLESSDPVVYATGLICIAMSLHRIRPGIDDITLTLSASPLQLYDRIVTAIDQVVLSRQHKGQAGILLALQRAKTHAEGDQLRKSWLRTRHAILLSQHLNFENESTAPTDDLIYRQRWVGGIYELDHFMSLILGFPHARDKSFTDILAKETLFDPEMNIDTKMRALRRITAVAAGKINEQNAQGQTSDPSFTCAMATEMASCAAAMPNEWWDADEHVKSPSQLAHEHLMAQMWFWEIQAFLHLPHMLQADSEWEYQSSSRNLCLQGCREMLKVFCLLRGTPGLSVYICSCEDFQGVVTAAMLLIGILLGITHGVYPSIVSLDEDFAVLDNVKDIFRYRSTGQGGSISRQGLKVVETLESFLTDSDQSAEPHQQPQSRSIILPYFGLIRIESKIPPLPKANRQTDLKAPEAYKDGSAVDAQSIDLYHSIFPDTQSHEPSPPSTSELSASAGSHNFSDDTLVEPVMPTFTDATKPTPSWDNDSMLPPINFYDADPSITTFNVADDVTDTWDHFLYGSELNQDWEVPNWQDVFEEWNGTTLGS